MRRPSKLLSFLLFLLCSALIALIAYNEFSDANAGPAHNAGPVEHIDANERREAALLMPVLGPVQKEIRIFRADIRSAFEEEAFAQLEQMAASLIEDGEDALFKTGSWKIAQFHFALGDRFGNSEDQFQADLARHQRWLKQFPDSSTAKIAYGDFLTKYAWFARGGGYAHTVTERGWRLFRERLSDAHERLLPMMDQTIKNPYWGTVVLRVALGQGWSDDDYERLMAYLKELAPRYWGYDIDRAYSLLPRWHGEDEDDWVHYAEWAANHPEGLGDEIYARIVISRVGNYGSVFRETSAQWSRTRSGLKSLLEKYPTSLTLANSAARLAVIGRDQKMAADLFEEISENFVEDSWINPEQFVHFRTWARTGKW